MKLIAFVIRHIIPIGLFIGAGLVILNASTPPPPTRIEGLGIDLLASPPLSPELAEVQLNAIQQSDVEYVRIEFNWSMIEAEQDVYNWSSGIPLDAFLSLAQSRGMKSVAVLTGFPVYLSTQEDTVNQKTMGRRWEKFVQANVDHFGEQIDIWQIGDQINSNVGARTLAQADAALYAKMLRAAEKIIKRSNPGDEVWMGSLVSAAASNCAVNPLSFLLEINSAKALTSADALTFDPRRGALAPESASVIPQNSPCNTSMQLNTSSLSAEVQSVQDLARQLGSKPLYITGLDWSSDELLTLQSGRSIDVNTLHADMLVRASTILAGANQTPIIFWQIDPLVESAAMLNLGNANRVIKDAKPLGELLGEGNLKEYGFQQGAQLNLFAWGSQGGDAAQTAILSVAGANQLSAFSVDTPSTDERFGIPVEVNTSGNAVVILNERPVLFIGRPGGWDAQLKANVANRLDLWRIEIRQTIAGWMSQLRLAFMHWVEDLFNKAKDSVVDWGEEKIRNLLN